LKFLDPNRNSLPLYMDPDNAFCPSILSHNASTHNVLLKITVPKRTGRKRKRGSDGPWEGDVEVANAAPPVDQVASVRRGDHPKTLLRRLQDNVDDYRVETVGVIKHTHRYRGTSPFARLL
jgi:general transcription factor 3C polypeptide 5 (transcription factor C subunit 1)